MAEPVAAKMAVSFPRLPVSFGFFIINVNVSHLIIEAEFFGYRTTCKCREGCKFYFPHKSVPASKSFQ